VRCFGGFTADYMMHAVFEELAKGTFFGEHAFIHIWDIVMIALLMAGVVGVYLHQAGRLDKSGKAGFYLTLMDFGLCVVGGCRS
jgi:hypothetical protein